MRSAVLRFSAFAVLLLLAGVAVAARQLCADPCDCKGGEKQKKSVRAPDVVRCIAKSRPIHLENVEIIGGDLDFGQQPLTEIPLTKGVDKLAGLPQPRSELDLDGLERLLGRRVPGVVVVRHPVAITGSIVKGAVVGTRPRANSATAYSPVVFLQRVDFRGTVFAKHVDLRYARFRLPVSFVNSEFQGYLGMNSVRFAQSAQFTNATFGGPVAFDGSEFGGRALFDGTVFRDPATANFERVVFRKGAWFHTNGRPTRLRSANFGEAEVDGGEALFNEVTFEGVANFEKSRFPKGARFVRAHFLNAAEFDGAGFREHALFSEAKFFEGADFAQTTFESTTVVSFDRAEFDKSASFTGARFAGAVQFVGVRMISADFLGVLFGGHIDLRSATIGTAEFGSANARTTFAGDAIFDSALFNRATFENALFGGSVSFSGVTFGMSNCDSEKKEVSSVSLLGCTPVHCASKDPVVLNLAAAGFSRDVDFTGAMFNGRLNLSHVAPEPGRARVKWSQIAKVFEAERLVLQPVLACPGLKEFVVDPGRSRIPKLAVLEWLERNFRAREQLADAREVFYQREFDETWGKVQSSESTWSVTKAATYGVVVGALTGFGVFPSRVLMTMTGVLFVLWMALFFCARRHACSYKRGDDSFTIKLKELPYRVSGDSGSAQGNRCVVALWVSIATLFGLQIKGAHVLVHRSSAPIWWMLLIARCIGLVLVAALAFTITQSMPGLERFLGWLPGV